MTALFYLIFSMIKALGYTVPLKVETSAMLGANLIDAAVFLLAIFSAEV
ncbi:hypothetical protein [Rhizobium skierniewicense]|nr:hypothetical protein [Rhizobium skierniewicense]NTF34116.1 hypothetical protein [Rhizobium skierniewicense]